jgi:PTH1 family peptidyl-tRNA hydrolase
MKLVIGLGNPGKQYQTTWHNVGFLALEQLKPSNWKHSDSCMADTTDWRHGDSKVILAKPQTFMNNSGDAVGALARYYKIEPKDIVVVHDEIDLPLGTVRVSRDASAAGHRGVQSIIDALGTKNFVRVRLGIRPAALTIATEDFVLQKIAVGSMMAFNDMLQKTVAALETIAEDGVTEAMNQFN